MSHRESEFAATGGDAGGGTAVRFHLLQPTRDLQSNWEVDLAKNLEEYLLKICSGEIIADQDHGIHSVNFAEAALLLQGSVQVYSKKVEYLYSLVLHALEFLSQKRQDQQENASIHPDERESNAAVDEENEMFLGLDDVPVEAKNCLDGGLDEDDVSKCSSKPPANLLVLEGDCVDSSGEAGELESYLLATCDFYGDFLLLDPCDSGAVFDFIKANAVGKENITSQRGSSVRSKTRYNNLPTPTGRSGGTAHKISNAKNQCTSPNQPSNRNSTFDINVDNYQPGYCPDEDMCHFEERGPDGGCSSVQDDSDDDNDPWKPLNPHEPGNLKIKPFRKVKSFRKQAIRHTKRNSLSSQFPVAKFDGVISPEFAELFEMQCHLQEKEPASQSSCLYEKLRRSLTFGEQEFCDGRGGLEDENDDTGCENEPPNFDQVEFDGRSCTYDMETEVPQFHGKQSDGAATFDGVQGFTQDDSDSHPTLDDLCRSHLDALLASIAESEKQTELAARVSTWKQRIEHTLEEQDMHPPFDIHLYGERILDKLSMEVDSGGSMSFSNVVMGQLKHDVARTFSALLQLVNNGDVDLQRAPSSGELICHTAENPFYVSLLRRGKRREEMENNSARKSVKSPSRKGGNNANPSTSEEGKKREGRENHSTRKRVKSPLRKGCNNANPSTSEAISPLKLSHQNGRFSVKLGRGNIIRCTPEGKRRRKSTRLREPFDLQYAG